MLVTTPAISQIVKSVDPSDGSWLLLHERQPNITGVPMCTGNYGQPDAVLRPAHRTRLQPAQLHCSKLPEKVSLRLSCLCLQVRIRGTVWTTRMGPPVSRAQNHCMVLGLPMTSTSPSSSRKSTLPLVTRYRCFCHCCTAPCRQVHSSEPEPLHAPALLARRTRPTRLH